MRILIISKCPTHPTNAGNRSGFEPGMTGPESVVLPLHHSPIIVISVLRLQRYKDFYKSKQKRVFFSQKTDKIP